MKRILILIADYGYGHLYRARSYETKRATCQSVVFLTDLSLYSNDSCSEIAGSNKNGTRGA